MLSLFVHTTPSPSLFISHHTFPLHFVIMHLIISSPLQFSLHVLHVPSLPLLLSIPSSMSFPFLLFRTFHPFHQVALIPSSMCCPSFPPLLPIASSFVLLPSPLSTIFFCVFKFIVWS